MLIFILTDVQYAQKAVFSFEKGSNCQNYSNSGSLHPVKKISAPLVKFYGPFCGWGAPASSLYRATMRRQFIFYQKFLVLINAISEGLKAEMTLKPSSGLNLCINLVITKYKLQWQYVKLAQLWPLTVNCFKMSSQPYLAGLSKMFSLHLYRPNDYTIEISVLLQIQFNNIFTNVPSIIFKSCH